MTLFREKRVLDYIKKYEMAAPGQTVLVAVSGGADSMCLLDILQKIDLNVRVLAAHYNHGLRGAESDRDQEFVEEFCRKRGIPFFTETGDVKGEADAGREGIEETARRMRYSFLRETAERQGAHRIATAHNADDNVETVIMNMARGSGLDGLCGIPPVRGNIIRPLLCLTREDIEDYLQKNDIPNIFDSSNDNQFFARNRIRHGVIPVLREKNPGLSMSVLSMTERLRQDRECLDNLALTAFAGLTREGGGGGGGGGGKAEGGEIRGSVSELMELPGAVRARVIRLALEDIGVTGESRIVKAVTELLSANAPSGEVNLKGGGEVRREYGEIVFSPVPPERGGGGGGGEDGGGFAPVDLELDTPAYIPELDLIITCKKGFIYNGTFHFKSSGICDNITVRPRLAGDKIKLAGRGCTKTLKKLFIEKKIPVLSRNRIPVFADGEGVVAVMGMGVAERCRPEPGDEVISMTICKTGNNCRS